MRSRKHPGPEAKGGHPGLPPDVVPGSEGWRSVGGEGPVGRWWKRLVYGTDPTRTRRFGDFLDLVRLSITDRSWMRKQGRP